MKTIYERLETQDLQRAIDNTRKSLRDQNSRIRKRLENMFLDVDVFFLTFTMSDKHINYKIDTYLEKIRKAFNYAGIKKYIVNEDYGSDNGRLHFHAVVSFTDCILNDLNNVWKYGAINFKPITRRKEKAIRLYITKLTYHSIKGTAGKMMYSRSLNNEATDKEIEELQKKYAFQKKFNKIDKETGAYL